MTDVRKKRRRKHEGTFADGATAQHTPLVLQVVGAAPNERPYLSIHYPNGGAQIAWIGNANALRGLARAILRALGDLDD